MLILRVCRTQTQFPEFSYRRVLANKHPRTTGKGSPP